MRTPGLVCPVIVRRHFLREPQRLPRPVREDELRAFFAVIEDVRDRAMVILMLRCGLRIIEVASLLLSDLFLPAPVLCGLPRAWWCMARVRASARYTSRPMPSGFCAIIYLKGHMP